MTIHWNFHPLEI